MDILLVSTPVAPIGAGIGGGVDVSLHNLLDAFSLHQHTISVCGPIGSRLNHRKTVPLIQIPGQLQQSCQTEGPNQPTKPHDDHPLNSVSSDGVLANTWATVKRIQHSYDVIINLAFDWLPIWLTDFIDTPVYHLVSMANENGHVARALQQLNQRDPQRIAFRSVQAAATFDFMFPVTTLSNGFDVEQFPKAVPAHGFLAWVGRISPEKGLEDAVAIARKVGMPIHVWGLEQNRDYCSRVNASAPHGTIVWRGFVPHDVLIQQIRYASALLMTPKWIEAFGNCGVEAICCGVPVVAYQKGGPMEIVEAGITGKLVPIGNISAAADAVACVMQLDRTTCQAAGHTRFSIEAYADRLSRWLDVQPAPRRLPSSTDEQSAHPHSANKLLI